MDAFDKNKKKIKKTLDKIYQSSFLSNAPI